MYIYRNIHMYTYIHICIHIYIYVYIYIYTGKYGLYATVNQVPSYTYPNHSESKSEKKERKSTSPKRFPESNRLRSLGQILTIWTHKTRTSPKLLLGVRSRLSHPFTKFSIVFWMILHHGYIKIIH